MKFLQVVFLFLQARSIYSQDLDYPRIGITVSSLKTQISSKDLDEDDGSRLFGTKSRTLRFGITGQINRNVVANAALWKISGHLYGTTLHGWYLSTDLALRLMVGHWRVSPFVSIGYRYSFYLSGNIGSSAGVSDLQSFSGLLLGIGVEIRPVFINLEFYPNLTSTPVIRRFGSYGSPTVNSIGATIGAAFRF